MTTKKWLGIVPLALFLSITIPASATLISPDPGKTNSPAKTEDPRARQLVQRLENIRDMDRSELTRSEKRGLRKEVKDIKKEMKAIKGGVYLSVGAIIIVILLLILLL